MQPAAVGRHLLAHLLGSSVRQQTTASRPVDTTQPISAALCSLRLSLFISVDHQTGLLGPLSSLRVPSERAKYHKFAIILLGYSLHSPLQMPLQSIGYGVTSADSPMAPLKYEIADPGADDVVVEVAYCGICHSDIHMVRAEWGPTSYPCVPGHELTGQVVKVGTNVTNFKAGDRVAMGAVVDSCEQCNGCKSNLENYCSNVDHTNRKSFGGYGQYVIAHQRFVLSVPDSLPLDRAAPLVCAGISVYSPIVATGMNKGGFKVGIIGLGGLGHMAVQFAAKMGNQVTVLSQSTGKKELAEQLGATDFISKEEEYKAQTESFDFIIDTVSANKPMGKYLNLLKIDGTLVMLGVPPLDDQPALDTFSLISRRRKIMGSMLGGLPEAQEMLYFCAEKQILPIIETINCEDINAAFDRAVKSDVKFRFVIDVKGTMPTI